MKLAIIITNDWELFGNGQGDYYTSQKEPLVKTLEIMRAYGAKLTVFAEVIQQLNALLQAPINEKLRNIASDWEETLSNIIDQGHDVQLHIHPQLIDNNLTDYNKWSIANFPKVEMFDIISRCKEYLEKTLRKTKTDYECIAFRAGGYGIQPSGQVIDNLLLSGIKCDSSVTKGFFGSFYNFRNSYSHFFPYFCKTDICSKAINKDSLLEIPIFSIPKLDSPLLRILSPTLYYMLFHYTVLSKEDRNWLNMRKQNNYNYPLKDKYSAQIKNSTLKFILSKFIQNSSMQFDYDKIPANILVNYIRKEWERINNRTLKNSMQYENCNIPVVLIGHCKELKNTYNIEQLMKLLPIVFDGCYEFFTISDFYNNFISNSSIYSNLDEHLKSNRLL
jgi:hypothetical protein